MTAHAPEIARVPGAVSLLGHALPLFRDPLGFLRSLPAHGDVVRIRLGPRPVFVVCDPGLTRRVLLDDRTFDKGGVIYDLGREAVGNGLAMCPHREHRRLRRLAQPAFRPARMPGYTRVMSEQIATVLGSWHDGQTIDAFAETQKITTRVTVATMFAGSSVDAGTAQMLRDFAFLNENLLRQMLLPPLLGRLPTRRNRRLHEARARIAGTVARVVADYRQSGADRGDLMSMLLAAEDDGARLSDVELDEQVMIFFYAGMEATASALAWALHLVAGDSDVQQRLSAEADAVLGGRVAGADDLPELPYARRVITETLRLYPPGWVFTRLATTDADLGGHRIPAGAVLVYSPYLIHHRPDLYAEPERFVPDRWDGADDLDVPRSALIPFGGGARKCVGDVFGTIEATLALASIASAWRLEPVPGTRVRPARSIILSPQGARLRVSARSRPPARRP